MKKESREKVKSTAQKTIRRRKAKEEEAIPYLKKCEEKSPKGVCIICGEFMKNCLDKHHPEGRKNNWTVDICASCHRVFDKMGGVEELKERRKRYLNYNNKLVYNLSKRKGGERNEMESRDLKKGHYKTENFRTQYGKKTFLKAKNSKYPSNSLNAIQLIENWIYYGRLSSMSYMLLPTLIKSIKSGKLKEEYEAILKELNPKGHEEYKKTGKIESYSKFKK